MTEQPATVGNKVGRCMLHNWVEERAVATIDTEETRTQIQRHGHRGILTLDDQSKMETVTTFKAAYVPPKGLGVRLQGIRGELLEKHIAQMISETVQAERKPPTLKTDFCSTTQKDFCVEGFVPLTPETTQIHDYKLTRQSHSGVKIARGYRSDHMGTIWERAVYVPNVLFGVTAAQTPKAPFRKWALFSTPISERLDEIDPPPDN